MLTDWYKTIKLGTYLIVPAGMVLDPARLPAEARQLVEGIALMPLALNVQGDHLALQFGCLGVVDSVKATGYCILKSG